LDGREGLGEMRALEERVKDSQNSYEKSKFIPNHSKSCKIHIKCFLGGREGLGEVRALEERVKDTT